MNILLSGIITTIIINIMIFIFVVIYLIDFLMTYDLGWTAVMQTDGFEHLKMSCPSLLTEILEYVAKVNEHSVIVSSSTLPAEVIDGGDVHGRRVKQRLLWSLSLSRPSFFAHLSLTILFYTFCWEVIGRRDVKGRRVKQHPLCSPLFLSPFIFCTSLSPPVPMFCPFAYVPIGWISATSLSRMGMLSYAVLRGLHVCF